MLIFVLPFPFMILEGQLSSARDGTSSITPDISHSTRQSEPNIKWDKIIPLILRLALVHGLEDGRESKSGDRCGKNVSEPQGHGVGLRPRESSHAGRCSHPRPGAYGSGPQGTHPESSFPSESPDESRLLLCG